MAHHLVSRGASTSAVPASASPRVDARHQIQWPVPHGYKPRTLSFPLHPTPLPLPLPLHLPADISPTPFWSTMIRLGGRIVWISRSSECRAAIGRCRVREGWIGIRICFVRTSVTDSVGPTGRLLLGQKHAGSVVRGQFRNLVEDLQVRT